MMNQRLILSRRPGLSFEPDCVEAVTGDVPEIGAGEFLVEIGYITLDVAMLGWMRDGRSYVPNIAIGETIRATSVGTVHVSNNDSFHEGDFVAGLFGAQKFAVSDGTGVVVLDLNQASSSQWAGSLGITTAFTAFAGLDAAGYNLAEKTVLVSGASGLVGGMAAQMAMDRGARVVGIAGGAANCNHVTETLGLDMCIDYRTGQFEDALKAACPDRVDVFFDNVGGHIFDTTLSWMQAMGTVVMCGQTAERGATEPAVVRNIRSTILERLRIQGFIVFDRTDLYPTAASYIGDAFQAGKLRIPYDEVIYDGGLDSFCDAYSELASGKHKGKHLLAL